MPKSKKQKKDIIDTLSDKLGKSKSMIFVDYKGLKVKEIDALRKECGKQDSEYMVAKKTLVKVAVDSNKVEAVDPCGIEGNLGMVFSYGDEIVPAKILKDFSKSHKALKVLCGVMNGEYIDENMVKSLADIPSKPELHAKLVGSLNSPVFGFVNALSGNLRGLVGVLDAVRESKSDML